MRPHLLRRRRRRRRGHVASAPVWLEYLYAEPYGLVVGQVLVSPSGRREVSAAWGYKTALRLAHLEAPPKGLVLVSIHQHATRPATRAFRRTR